ncbi:hypothetical protein P22_2898 [Propionispora sp. 2/2-37]|uniref:hypothetical protein n=1 Tax=Propionispora sp. 2/2-37 TaxID=1677858 RepID=UPI0006C041D3|nr:hypothetical protein [Propionispora sp. 2/2-37]CUH96787.1 hypothetical protein P22_2898 [Propionispora sp. 2/2-37]
MADYTLAALQRKEWESSSGCFALDVRKMKAAIRAGERAAEAQHKNIVKLIS